MPQQLNEFEICISHQKFNDHAVYLGYFEDEFLLTRSQTDEHHCHFIIHRRISHMNFRSNEKNWFRCSSFFASLTSNQQRHEKNGKKHHSHPFLPPPTTYCNRLRPYQYPAGRFGSVTTLSGYFFWGVEVQLSHPNFGRGSSGISVFFLVFGRPSSSRKNISWVELSGCFRRELKFWKDCFGGETWC